MRSLRVAPPPPVLLLLVLLLLLAAGHGAVITGACDRDQQCGGGMCCAISLWIRSLRMCTPMGNLGEDCHPLSHRVSWSPGGCGRKKWKRILPQREVPFSGQRMHHTCPCLPGLACLRTSPSKFKCLPGFRKKDVFF
ncbi:prokineticin-2 isoform X1 [Melanerpes formicivorus]|uniref:prokineticin-2 isoform X1 n=1 Tax=Melanerpes formicivorus TaxID=211600 RepID=UPI00359011F9